MDGPSLNDSIPNIFTDSDDEVNVPELSEEEDKVSDEEINTGFIRPITGYNLPLAVRNSRDGGNSWLRQSMDIFRLEESKQLHDNFADRIRMLNRNIGLGAELSSSQSSYSESESLDWGQPMLSENVAKIDYKGLSGVAIKRILECQICYGQMNENLMCYHCAQTW